MLERNRIITWILAIGLSFPISDALLDIIGETMTGSTVVLKFNPYGVLFWLGVVFALSILSSILPARNAARLTINEVLAYEYGLNDLDLVVVCLQQPTNHQT